MFGLGATELVILLVIVLVVFGGTKLRSLGSDLGGAISEFKSSVKEAEPDESNTDANAAAKTEEKQETSTENKD